MTNPAPAASAAHYLVISPVLLNSKGKFNIRDAQMRDLHRVLSQPHHALYSPRGDINILKIEDDFRKDDAYWGGDGIVIKVDGRFSAGEVFSDINESFSDKPLFVVFDPETGEYIGKPESPMPSAPQKRLAKILPFGRRR